MKKIKQYLIQKGVFIIIIPEFFIIYNFIYGVQSANIPNVLLFICYFLAFALAFMSVGFILRATFKPYTEKIATNINVKKTVITLPNLYSFANCLEFDISIPINKNVVHFLSENGKGPFLDLSKFDIKLLDQNEKEIKIKMYAYSSKTQNINIKLENEKEITKARKLIINTDKEINLSVEYSSFNKK